MKGKTAIVSALVAATVCGRARAGEAEDAKLFRCEHAVVSYSSGIGEVYVEAIATTAQTARAVAVEQFGLNMPRTVGITVRSDRRGRVRLFNDGQDHMSLTIRSERDLRKPAESGIFHIYGLCHEVGHIAMYRVIRDHSWMTAAAAEGWAHYIGSRIVDSVHTRKGSALWPDRYDYLADGTRRLGAQLARKNPAPIVKGARLWQELADVVGDKGVAPIFAAWGKTKIDPSDPGAALRKTLLATNGDRRLTKWWNRAEPLMVLKRPKSGFTARRAKPSELMGKPIELARDDGAEAGKNSIAGGGHAVRFEVQGDSWYLTSVRVHGSKYGSPRPPRENFHVWLCDKDFKVIADFPFPYSRFTRGRPKCVTLKTPPTNVPQRFIVCAGFNPTRTKGVFVSRDRKGSGNSITGLPGRGLRTFNKGDWLVRAGVDQLRIADPLKLPGQLVALNILAGLNGGL